MELKHIATHTGRLSAFLREEMQLSSGLMNRLKWQDQLFVNGIPVHTDYPVQPGDVITVPLDEPEPDYPAQMGELTVLYEDDHFLAVDKPAGMLVHPSHAQFTDTLANFVLGYYQKTGQHSAFHPLTRLDRATYGVVLLAKNAHIHALLGRGKIQKTYHALVYGQLQQESGVIDAPIMRRPLPSLLRQVHPEGKPSVSAYRLLETGDAMSKLSLQPITGRTHQLRVHCAYIGHPILGDPQYGSEASRELSSRYGLTSQLLCAKEISFVHPITGQSLSIRSQMDATL